ncbi:ribonuclease Z [Hufsiella ginkgonis]|uniref:Ribonuclease Z n=1 Tax=Hufsiella ginkgonis TaxID=2695274 RepID=A0A7K1XWW6_9SPHI|nr:ribonuclease Z [Hufsiella ginkgonis]MXV15485.1 ribonuclease Z [Hufsiella ginkgonis]
MRFEVTILGSSSATPIFNRNPSAQLLNINEKYFLIDCGEGTQLQLIRFGLKAQRIDYIFISHLHGDHYLGLVGLLSSLHLNGRSKPMNVFGPPELKEIIDIQLLYSQTNLRYPILFYATDPAAPGVIFQNNDITVETFALNHRIPTTGFRFTQKRRQRRVIKEKIDELGIPPECIPLLKRGIDFTDKQGVVHLAADLTREAEVPRSYAYCSDTLCDGSYFPAIARANTLYHEATFMHDMIDRARETFHTTALQAGQAAADAGIGYLLIGHFSARYRDLAPLLDECRTVFTNTLLAVEGNTFTL